MHFNHGDLSPSHTACRGAGPGQMREGVEIAEPHGELPHLRWWRKRNPCWRRDHKPPGKGGSQPEQGLSWLASVTSRAERSREEHIRGQEPGFPKGRVEKQEDVQGEHSPSIPRAPPCALPSPSHLGGVRRAPLLPLGLHPGLKTGNSRSLFLCLHPMALPGPLWPWARKSLHKTDGGHSCATRTPLGSSVDSSTTWQWG